MAICDQCSSAVRSLRPHDWPLPPQERRGKVHATLPRHQDLSDVECWICHKFFRWLELENSGVLEIWRKESLRVEFKPYSRILIDKPGPGPVLGPFFMEILPPGYTKGDLSCNVELNFFTGEDLAASQAIAPKFGGMGAFNFDLVCTWFNQCTRHHEKCKTFSTQWFPTRLIYLGSQNCEVRLILSGENPPNGPYMTLSHRWGPQEFTKLESSTIKQLQNAIDVDALPRTFQDAIKIARLLGVDYIWIDALCIKQDPDLLDWELESLNMGKVYLHALLNISATLSHDGSESLFDQQPQSHILPSEIELEYKGQLHTYYTFDGDIWKDEIDDAPLNHRAWVFQERFLAPRVLHFGRHQIGWECLELEALEMFPGGLPGHNAMSNQIKSTRRKFKEERAPEPNQRPDKDFIDDWHNLVNAYSKAELTYSEDKLIAFAGVAKITMESRTDRYAAGMWEKTLLYHLPWARYTSDREAFPISGTSGRAPSWSWASVDGEIIFPPLLGGVRAAFAENLEFVDPIDGAGNSFTGPCSIRVECLRFPVDVELMDENEDITSFDVEGFHFSVGNPFSETVMDVEIPFHQLRLLIEQKKLFLAPLFASNYFFSAILLAPVHGADSYFRLGAVQIHLTVSSKSSSDEDKWNTNTMHFMRHCFAQSKSAHIINIY